MPRKIFVYPHPINTYIIKQLGITVENFVNYMLLLKELSLLRLLATKKLKHFLFHLFILFTLSATKLWIRYIQTFLKLQDDYLLHLERYRRTKKIIDDEV